MMGVGRPILIVDRTIAQLGVSGLYEAEQLS